MSQPSRFTPPPVPQVQELTQGSAVRRYHTISSTLGRNGRIAERRDSEEAAVEEAENDTEWTGGAVSASDRQASLQRNLSLPSRYHRAARDQSGAPLPPSHSMGGLASLDAGPEDEDGDWSGVASAMYDNDEDDELNHIRTSQTNPENAYSAVGPPSASGNVRRHVSMTDGQRARNKATNLQRYPTMSGKAPVRSSTMNATTEAPDDNYTQAYPEDDAGDYEDPTAYSQESAYGGVQTGSWDHAAGNDPTWRNNNPTGTPDWRVGQQGQPANIDSLTNSLSNLELQQRQASNYARGGPRFDPNAAGNPHDYVQLLQQQKQQQAALAQVQRLQLNTEIPSSSGPISEPAYPGPGHSLYGATQRESISRASGEEHVRTGSGSDWEKKGMLKGRGSNPNIAQSYQGGYGGAFGNMPPPPQIPAQYLNQFQGNRLNAAGGMGAGVGAGGYGVGPGLAQGGAGTIGQPLPGQQNTILQQQQVANIDPAAFLSSPIDVPTMIAQKGYNPATFDTKPPFARYFVIKSYTEDDVHKSLKYEIWSSTEPGNKRLDKAFKECAGRGPIYLFFSVNASGHFCGMAEMLTPVDYTRSSTVWASDKWKGVFKVRWIFVRDIPNAVLRNIRLNNTQERKPVTNSRDTQELLPEAGHEMLRIFFTHPAKTSLLQDFAFYELQSLQKQQQQQQGLFNGPGNAGSPPPGHASPHQTPQHPYAMTNNHAAYNQSPLSGNLQLSQGQPPLLGANMMGSMAMPMGLGHQGMQNPGPISHGVGSQVAQSVLRGTSPGPIGSGVPGMLGNVGYQSMNLGVGNTTGNSGAPGNGGY